MPPDSLLNLIYEGKGADYTTKIPGPPWASPVGFQPESTALLPRCFTSNRGICSSTLVLPTIACYHTFWHLAEAVQRCFDTITVTLLLSILASNPHSKLCPECITCREWYTRLRPTLKRALPAFAFVPCRIGCMEALSHCLSCAAQKHKYQ